MCTGGYEVHALFMSVCVKRRQQQVPEIKPLVLPDVLHDPNDLQSQHVLPQIWREGGMERKTDEERRQGCGGYEEKVERE